MAAGPLMKTTPVVPVEMGPREEQTQPSLLEAMAVWATLRASIPAAAAAAPVEAATATTATLRQTMRLVRAALAARRGPRVPAVCRRGEARAATVATMSGPRTVPH